MSPELKQFYRDMQAWIDNGMPKDHNKPNFTIIYGLCSNLVKWMYRNNINPYSPAGRKLSHELNRQFEKAGLRKIAPLDKSYDEYNNCLNHYTNPARLAWIKAHAE